MRRSRRRVLAAACAALLLLVVVSTGAGVPATWLIAAAPVPDPDAIVSLASHEWERLPMVVRLASAYPRSRILLTQPTRVTIHNCYDCSHRVDYLVGHGIERERIHILQQTVRNTFDEAVAVRRIAYYARFKTILVVTSPYHTRRALATFRAVFGAESPVTIGVCSLTPGSPARPQWWWAHSYDRRYVAYEAAAILANRYRHAVPIW